MQKVRFFMIFIKLLKITKTELEVAAIFPEQFWKAHGVYFMDFKFFETNLYFLTPFRNQNGMMPLLKIVKALYRSGS